MRLRGLCEQVDMLLHLLAEALLVLLALLELRHERLLHALVRRGAAVELLLEQARGVLRPPELQALRDLSSIESHRRVGARPAECRLVRFHLLLMKRILCREYLAKPNELQLV